MISLCSPGWPQTLNWSSWVSLLSAEIIGKNHHAGSIFLHDFFFFFSKHVVILISSMLCIRNYFKNSNHLSHVIFLKMNSFSCMPNYFDEISIHIFMWILLLVTIIWLILLLISRNWVFRTLRTNDSHVTYGKLSECIITYTLTCWRPLKIY